MVTKQTAFLFSLVCSMPLSLHAMDAANPPFEITHRTPKEFLEQYKKDLDQYEKAFVVLKESLTKLRESGEKAARFITSAELRQIATCYSVSLPYPEFAQEKPEPSKIEDVSAVGALCIQVIESGCAIIQQRREMIRGKRDETNECIKLAEAAYSYLE